MSNQPREHIMVKQEDLKVGDVIIPWYSREAIITGFEDAKPGHPIAARYVKMAPYTKGGQLGFNGSEMTLEHGSYHRLVVNKD